jgi:hypothetical protein
MKENNPTQNMILEIVLLIPTIVLAALLDNYVAHLTTSQIDNMLTKFLVDILIGLVVGIGILLFVRYIWAKIELIFVKWQDNQNIV